MTKSIFATAFLLGATAVIWMAGIFVGSDVLALTVTVVIGCVYTLGFVELVHFRRATATLCSALDNLPEQVTSLRDWLNKLDPSLQNNVQLRIEGERVALPAPVLTPYLVGLLVMLGLLGTFVGMVDTLKGAVVALEGSTELQAIRAGLAAPIQGLGLAFGTSVAGVAASAMLGLMSTLSRRERMLETRRLDRNIATKLRAFSLTHNRQETYKAMQMQAQALPDVADRLNTMADKLERMGDQLSNSLTTNQESFHQSTQTVYADLASAVDKSLRESTAESGRIVAESGRLAGENLKPILKDTLAEISTEIQAGTQATHQQLTQTAEAQLETLSGRFTDTSEAVNQAWQSGLNAHERANEALLERMNASFQAFSEQCERMTTSLIDTFDRNASAWTERQASGDQQRLEIWTDSFGQAQERAATQLAEASKSFGKELKHVSDLQQTSLKAVTQDFASLSSTLNEQWQRAGEQSVAQQQQITDSLQATARTINDNALSTSTELLSEITVLMKSSEQLVQARIDSEKSWLDEHGERINTLTATLKNELTTLRDDEQQRGNAAIERLSSLETAVTDHLAKLGTELEAPMTRLIETASETPRAAAEVIEHLRREISNNIERDNQLLEERRRIMSDLNSLSSSLEQSTAGQREAMEQLVSTSGTILQEVGTQFTAQVSTEAKKLTDVATHFASSATEMASLGDAFNLAVQQFSESNQHLVDNLGRIEESLNQSSVRSDEQLGYYVAQAREIIDHSILSQKQMLDELRQLSRQNDLLTAEVN